MSNIDSKIEAETSTSNLVTKVYEKMENNISKFRKVVNRPLTISEKILI
jgi:aconitate hydratase